MATNPYAAHTAASDPLRVISETPGRLRTLAESLGPDGLKKSWAPGKWTAEQIICHLADCEIAFGFRFRQALAEPHHMIQPFSQDGWARSYSQLDPHLALQSLAALRAWNINLLKTVKEDTLSKPVSHPERGQMVFRTLIETMAGHDLNHLRQIETIASTI